MRAGRAIREGDLVAVTGATGFIGTHVVKALLDRGYRVRGTVRDASDEEKVAHLKKIADESEGDLELVSADLMKKGSFDEPLQGCTHVCHVASSVRLQAKDPQREIVDVAVDGTNNVLDAVDDAGIARRVVVTSSIAAVVDEHRGFDHIFDEEDWNESATLDDAPYSLSKVQAERAAWARVEGRTTDAGYDLVTVNPVVVLGPIYTRVHKRSSPAVIVDLLSGKYPAVPDLRLCVVDVRDVAEAHVLALETESASGRHILANDYVSLRDAAASLRERFPESKTPRLPLPNPLMYGVALFDKRLSFSFLREHLSKERRIDAAKSEKQLGLRYRPVEETLTATAESARDLGYF